MARRNFLCVWTVRLDILLTDKRHVPKVSGIIIIDPVDTFPSTWVLKIIPEDIPIHIISTNILSEINYYFEDSRRPVLWHDEHYDKEIEDIIHAVLYVVKKVRSLGYAHVL